MFDFFSLTEEKKAEIVKRFWEKVDKNGPDGCWIWSSNAKKVEYGRLRVSRTQKIKAHRLSYMLKYLINIPPSLNACHSCDRVNCVNPEHIFLGTPKHNSVDSARKDRRAYIKLKDRLKMAAEAIAGVTHKELAQKYNIKHEGSVYYYIHHHTVQAVYGKIDLSNRIKNRSFQKGK